MMSQESKSIAVEPLRGAAQEENRAETGEATLVLRPSSALEQLIQKWLEHVYSGNSRSQRTIDAYQKNMADFRAWLAQEGLDLDSSEHDRIAAVARAWASHRRSGSRRAGTEVAQSTFDLRLATISSFYVFIQEHQRHEGKPEYPNPIARIKRPKITAYASAFPLEKDDVAEGLERINRETPQGLRDYAILSVGLRTGRRGSELIGLRMKHLTWIAGGKKVRVVFEHCKGGKVMRDTLDEETTAVLLDYLRAVYDIQLQKISKEAPVWVSFSKRNKGQAMSIHTLYDICERYLSTTKIHALRHTFTHQSEEDGSTLSDLQHRLGHATLNQTGMYAKALRSDENPVGEKLTQSFRIRRYTPKGPNAGGDSDRSDPQA